VRTAGYGNAVLVRRTGGRSRWLRGLVRRAAGWIGADRNPLCRPIDRFEGGLRIVLLLGFLIGIPVIAPAAGQVMHDASLRQVRKDASWQQVSAVLTQSAPTRYPGYGSLATYWVAATWRAPSGASRSGMVPIANGAAKGDKVSIWIDRNGYMTGRHPVTMSMVQARTILAEIGSVAGFGLALLMVAVMIRLLLNRRRLANWGIEWACFGPRWSARRWPRS
jgi:hypothetical protein